MASTLLGRPCAIVQRASRPRSQPSTVPTRGLPHADPGHPGCPVTFAYCAQSNWSTDLGFGISASGDSLGNGGWATHDRGAEMISGSIHYAQYLIPNPEGAKDTQH